MAYGRITALLRGFPTVSPGQILDKSMPPLVPKKWQRVLPGKIEPRINFDDGCGVPGSVVIEKDRSGFAWFGSGFYLCVVSRTGDLGKGAILKEKLRPAPLFLTVRPGVGGPRPIFHVACPVLRCQLRWELMKFRALFPPFFSWYSLSSSRGASLPPEQSRA